MKTGMHIGTVVDKDSLSALTEAVVRIMSTPGDQQTIRHGLDALAQMARVENVTIQHCVVNGDRSLDVIIDADNLDAEVRVRPPTDTPAT